MAKKSGDELWSAILSWCDRRERSEMQVRRKLDDWEVRDAKAEELIQKLKSLKALNDLRFAQALVSDSFRFRNWGRKRIAQKLYESGVDETMATNALEMIDPIQYREKLLSQINAECRKRHSIRDYSSRMKLAAVLGRRGFEPEMIFSCFDELDQG